MPPKKTNPPPKEEKVNTRQRASHQGAAAPEEENRNVQDNVQHVLQAPSVWFFGALWEGAAAMASGLPWPAAQTHASSVRHELTRFESPLVHLVTSDVFSYQPLELCVFSYVCT